MKVRAPLAASLAALGLLAAPAARASSFDVAGRYRADPAALVTFGFNRLPARAGLTPIDAVDLAAPGGDTGAAIEGAGYARIDSDRDRVRFSLALPPRDVRVQARLFVRKNRVVADLEVRYARPGSPDLNARFFPTGVTTSDGWYEIATNPVSVEGSRAPAVALAILGSDVEVDALEIVPDGEFSPQRACVGAHHEQCGRGEYCAGGSCRDGAAGVPLLPPPIERAALVRYLAARLRLFFGGRFTREARLPVALARLASLERADEPFAFWNGFATAIRELHDWHTRIRAPLDLAGRGVLPVCFVEGDADRSHAAAPRDPTYPDVLVSHVGPSQTSGLRPGDRLVAVDGMHPVAWVHSLEGIDWSAWRADDPRVYAEALEGLPSAIRRWATELTVVRCDPSLGVCGPPESLAVADLPTEAPAWSPYCDHRPAYHLKSGNPDPGRHDSWRGPRVGEVVESASGEGIWSMIWDDAYAEPGAESPYAAPLQQLRDNARAVILDHRLGNGGTEPGAESLTRLFRLPAKLGVATGRAGFIDFLDPPYALEDAKAIFGLLRTSSSSYDVGDASAKSDLPTALLLARDGSASDWFPEAMRGLPNVRIFGRRTAGGFSSYMQFDYYGQFAWQVASGDYVRSDGTTHLGEGVPPDEEIVPRQSDLLAGRDTAYERALAWVRSCAAGGCR